MFYTQEFGYKIGTKISEELSGGLLSKITQGASILGMFIIGALVKRWSKVLALLQKFQVVQPNGAYIQWDKLSQGSEGIKEALTMYSQLGYKCFKSS